MLGRTGLVLLVHELLMHTRLTVLSNIFDRLRRRRLRLEMGRQKTRQHLGVEGRLRRLTVIQKAPTGSLQVQRADIMLLHDTEDHLLERLLSLLLLTDLGVQR